MAIKDTTRKELWGKSGNSCAICKEQLIVDDSADSIVVGQECHIIPKKESNPRYLDTQTDKDSYENLILLCSKHHTIVDRSTHSYTAEDLRSIKFKHEKEVRESLNAGNLTSTHPKYLVKVNSGKDLCNMVDGVLGYSFDHPEPTNQRDADFFGSISQSLDDNSSLLSEFEPARKAEIMLWFKDMLDDLEGKGYLLFGCRLSDKINNPFAPDKLVAGEIFHCKLTKKDDPEVITGPDSIVRLIMEDCQVNEAKNDGS